MRSKILSFSLIRSTLKQQIWVFALSCVSFLLAFPVSGLRCMESWNNYKELTQPMKRELFVQQCVDSGIDNILVAAVLVSIVSALVGFFYLHSSKKIDFYHSFPVRREKLFLNQFVSSIVIYLIPALAGMLLLMLIGAFQGVFSLAAFGNGLLEIMVGLFYYIVCFALAALAMLLTGKIVVGVLGVGVLFGGALIAYWILEACEEIFFWTHNGGDSFARGILQVLSPVFWMQAVKDGTDGVSRWIYAGLLAPIGALLVLLCLYVYRKRRSEAAGHSMAFTKAASVIEVVLVVLCTFISGVFFRGFTNGGHTARWFLFGVVFGLVLSYSVIQMIYYLDVRSLLKGKKVFIVSAIIIAGIASVLQFDLLKYNTYLPKQDEASDIFIQMGDTGTLMIGSSVSYSIARLPGIMDGTGMPDLPENIHGIGTDDDIYEAVQLLIAEAERVHKEGDDNTTSIPVEYVLNSGRIVRRIYVVNWDHVKYDLAKLYDREKYLEYWYPLRSVSSEQTGPIYLSDMKESDKQLFTGDDTDRIAFLEALQKDMGSLNSKIITEETPVGILTVDVNVPRESMRADFPVEQVLTEYGVPGYDYGNYYVSTQQTYIYPSYSNTLAVLEDMGYHLTSEIDPAQVESITVYGNEESEGNAQAYDSDVASEESNKKYTDIEDLEKICGSLIPYELTTQWAETLSDAYALVKMKDGSSDEIYCNIRTDIPQEYLN